MYADYNVLSITFENEFDKSHLNLNSLKFQHKL